MILILIILSLFAPVPLPLYRAGDIMPMGDSITLGAQSTDGTGYRGPLDRSILVPHRLVGTSYRSGWSIFQLTPYARAWTAQYRPAYVLLDAGTNDAGKYQNRTTDQMVADMRALLGEILAGGAGVVVVAQPTITPYNTAAQQATLNNFDNRLPALAAEFGGRVKVVDMRGVEIGADRIHPDDAGYREMARRWLVAVPVLAR